MSDDTAGRAKKQYAAPKLNKVPSEEAKAFLLEGAARGNQEAEDLLNLLRQTSASL